MKRLNKKILTTIIAFAIIVVSATTCFADVLLDGESLEDHYFIDKTYNVITSTVEEPTIYNKQVYYTSTPMGVIGQLPNLNNQFLTQNGFNARVDVEATPSVILTTTTIEPFFDEAVRTLTMECTYTIENVFVGTSNTNIANHYITTYVEDSEDIMQGGLPENEEQTDLFLEYDIYVMKQAEIYTDDLNVNVIQELTTQKVTIPVSIHENILFFSQDIYDYIKEQITNNGNDFAFRKESQNIMLVKQITAKRTIDLLTRQGAMGTIQVVEEFGEPIQGKSLTPIDNAQINSLFAYSHVKGEGELPSIAEIGYFLGGPIEAFMSCEILPNVQIGHIFIACIVLTFLLIYLKFFAGG